MADETPATSGFFSARPIVRIDGDVEADLSNGVVGFSAHETLAGLSRCELSVGNWGQTNGEIGFLYFDRDLLDFGKTVSIEMGDGDARGVVFAGRIMGLEGHFPSGRTLELLVLAEDRLQDLRMTRRSRTFEDATDTEVMERVARDHGLQPEIDVDGPRHKVLAQLNQSDLAFLRDRARALDAALWLEGKTLRVEKRAGAEDSEAELTYGQRLHEFSVLADLAGQCTSFAVGGWDVSTKSGVEETAEADVLSGELADGQYSGAAILEQAIGKRQQSLVHTLPGNETEARTLARARFRTVARRFVTGSGIAEGDARIRVGATVKLKGLGPLFRGAYEVVETQHSFDPVNGFRTRFRVERPGLGS